MTAYVLVIREGSVTDEEAMAEYWRKVTSTPPHEKLELLALYGGLHGLEGKMPDGVVLMQFPTVEDAKDWYYGPAYQDAAPHRIKAADYRAFILEGM